MAITNAETTLTIKKLEAADVEGVAEIHLEQFPRSRSTLLGRPYVRKMYRWFLTEQPELSIIIISDGRPVGFAVGAIGGYGRRLMRYALPEIIWGLVSHPMLLTRGETFNLWTSYAKALLPRLGRREDSGSNISAEVKASLASIAVSKAAQGRGAGKALMAAFEVAARGQGATVLGLSVVAENTAARRLYEACGWKVQREDSDTGSAYYRKRL